MPLGLRTPEDAGAAEPDTLPDEAEASDSEPALSDAPDDGPSSLLLRLLRLDSEDRRETARIQLAKRRVSGVSGEHGSPRERLLECLGSWCLVERHHRRPELLPRQLLSHPRVL